MKATISPFETHSTLYLLGGWTHSCFINMQIILLELSGSTWTNIVQLHLERGCDPSGDIVSVCSRVCMPACSLCIALLFVQPGVNSFNISFLLMQRKKKICWWWHVGGWQHWTHLLYNGCTIWHVGLMGDQTCRHSVDKMCRGDKTCKYSCPLWHVLSHRRGWQIMQPLQLKQNVTSISTYKFVFAHGCVLYCRCRNVDSAKNSVWSTILLNKYRTYLWAIYESSLHVQLL